MRQLFFIYKKIIIFLISRDNCKKIMVQKPKVLLYFRKKKKGLQGLLNNKTVQKNIKFQKRLLRH
jgi:hypothetical protein